MNIPIVYPTDSNERWDRLFESGYFGFRCTVCGTWRYSSEPLWCECNTKNKEKELLEIQAIILDSIQDGISMDEQTLLIEEIQKEYGLELYTKVVKELKEKISVF